MALFTHSDVIAVERRTFAQIVSTADSTTVAIDSIYTLSQEIADRSQDAQTLGDMLNVLSTELLENIQIFKRPAVEGSTATEHTERELAL